MHRREGLAKLTGRERYVDDLPLGDFLWGMTVRSRAPRGRITGLRLGPDVNWHEFVQAVSQDSGYPIHTVDAVIRSSIRQIEAALLNGQVVSLRGFGRDQGRDALEKYTQTKSVWVNL